VKHEYKTIGIASGLVTLNIILMALISFTPLTGLMDYVFSYLILGVLFFGALLTGGVWIAKSGIRNQDTGKAYLGTGILQFAYGLFGGGVLSMASTNMYPIVLGLTLAVSVGIALASAGLVYLTGKDFSKWGMYSNYIFLGVMGMAFIGTFSGIFGLITFFLALIGFMVYLVYEIYILREQKASPLLNGLGIYVAFMGVFIQILQMVVRMFFEE